MLCDSEPAATVSAREDEAEMETATYRRDDTSYKP